MQTLLAALSVAVVASLAAGEPLFPGVGDEEPSSGNDLVSLTMELRDETSPPAVVLHFNIHPGWHLYWKNPGDTGAPMILKWTLPEGVSAGEPVWPAPERHEHGGLLDYIYEDSLTLVVPLQIDAGADAPSASDIALDAEWLVCREACLPGFAEVTASPWSGDLEAPLRQASLRHPAPADDTIRTRWEGATLIVEAPGFEALQFFPEQSRDAQLVHPIEDGASDSPRLALRYNERVGNAPRVRGVLRVDAGGRALPRFLSIDIEGPGTASTSSR